MSDNQRRALCRLIFLLACAIPTAICGYRICHRQTAAGWEQVIKAELGIQADIDFVATPSPSVTMLHGVRLKAPEHGVLLETAAVEIRTGKQIQITFTAPVTQVDNLGLAKLVRPILQNPLSWGVDNKWRIDFSEPTEISRIDASELFAGLANNQTSTANAQPPLSNLMRDTLVVQQLQIGIEPSFGGTLLAANFSLANPNALQKPDDQPSKIEVELKKEPGSHEIQLNTFDQPLPCWLAAGFTDSIAIDLGDEATFAGEIKMFASKVQQPEFFVSGRFDRLQAPAYGFHVPTLSADFRHCHFANGAFNHWNAVLNVPHQGQELSFQISPENLYSPTRELYVGHAIESTISQGISPRVAVEPGSGRIQ